MSNPTLPKRTDAESALFDILDDDGATMTEEQVAAVEARATCTRENIGGFDRIYWFRDRTILCQSGPGIDTPDGWGVFGEYEPGGRVDLLRDAAAQAGDRDAVNIIDAAAEGHPDAQESVREMILAGWAAE